MKLPISAYLSWLHVSWLMHRIFGLKTYGIGWLASKVTEPFNFRFSGVPFCFLPEAARSYCLLPAGIPNEPETHKFFKRLLRAVPNDRRVAFIDVGANVGEFAIPMAYEPCVASVIAYEPHATTVEALRASAELVPEGKMTVIRKAVGASAGFSVFDMNEKAPSGAGLRDFRGMHDGAEVEVCTLDDTLSIEQGTALIMLIDIEGGELNALRGGLKLIATHHPLIVFEYNRVTRRYFKLSEVNDLLGEGYCLYRLRSEDGGLDFDLSSTWNVVALPLQGPWRFLSHHPQSIVG